MAFQNLQNNIAEQRPFGVNFEPTLTGSAACSGRLIRAASASVPDHILALIILASLFNLRSINRA